MSYLCYNWRGRKWAAWRQSWEGEPKPKSTCVYLIADRLNNLITVGGDLAGPVISYGKGSCIQPMFYRRYDFLWFPNSRHWSFSDAGRQDRVFQGAKKTTRLCQEGTNQRGPSTNGSIDISRQQSLWLLQALRMFKPEELIMLTSSKPSCNPRWTTSPKITSEIRHDLFAENLLSRVCFVFFSIVSILIYFAEVIKDNMVMKGKTKVVSTFVYTLQIVSHLFDQTTIDNQDLHLQNLPRITLYGLRQFCSPLADGRGFDESFGWHRFCLISVETIWPMWVYRMDSKSVKYIECALRFKPSPAPNSTPLS